MRRFFLAFLKLFPFAVLEAIGIQRAGSLSFPIDVHISSCFAFCAFAVFEVNGLKKDGDSRGVFVNCISIMFYYS